MKSYFALIFLLVLGVNDITRVNSLKKEAKQAFLSEDYQQAITIYHTLLDSLSLEDEVVRLDLANAYYRSGKMEEALQYYQALGRSAQDNQIRSTAWQQLGVMAHQNKKLDEALAFTKSALKADPGNEEARYNYELLKQLKEEQDQQDQKQDQQDQEKEQENQDKQDQQNKDQQNEGEQEDQEPQENEQQQDQDQEGDQEQEKEGEQEQQEQKGDEQKPEEKEGEQENAEEQSEDAENQEQQKPSLADRLEEINISEDKARMILEAMKNAEVQYLQQNKRKANKAPQSGKPDW